MGRRRQRAENWSPEEAARVLGRWRSSGVSAAACSARGHLGEPAVVLVEEAFGADLGFVRAGAGEVVKWSSDFLR